MKSAPRSRSGSVRRTSCRSSAARNRREPATVGAGFSRPTVYSDFMRRAVLIAVAASVFVLTGQAQVRPIYDMGTAGLTQILQRLQTTASVLHTGAHPDDEDSAFIAREARGDHARVA